MSPQTPLEHVGVAHTPPGHCDASTQPLLELLLEEELIPLDDELDVAPLEEELDDVDEVMPLEDTTPLDDDDECGAPPEPPPPLLDAVP